MPSRVRNLPLFLSCLALVALAGRGHATSWELELHLVGPNATNQAIDVRQTSTGTLLGSFNSGADAQFNIDFNGQAGADVQLQPNVQYTVVFKGWNKACYVMGDLPPGQPNYDDSWRVDANNNTTTHLSGPELQDVWGFPSATYYVPLSLSLVIESTTRIGDKTTYRLRATASGGNGTYSFAWSNVGSVQSPPTANPNYALRTALNSSRVIVTCTVTSGGASVQRSIELSRF